MSSRGVAKRSKWQDRMSGLSDTRCASNRRCAPRAVPSPGELHWATPPTPSPPFLQANADARTGHAGGRQPRRGEKEAVWLTAAEWPGSGARERTRGAQKASPPAHRLGLQQAQGPTKRKQSRCGCPDGRPLTHAGERPPPQASRAPKRLDGRPCAHAGERPPPQSAEPPASQQAN